MKKIIILIAMLFIGSYSFAQFEIGGGITLDSKSSFDDYGSEEFGIGGKYYNSNVEKNMFSLANPMSISSFQEGWSMKRKFWLNFGVGPGYTMLKSDDYEAELEFSGVSVTAVLSLGVFITENQVLFADFFGQTLSDPTIKFGGEEMTNDVSVGWSGGGIGFAHYFKSNSLFLKGSFGVSRLTFDFNDEEFEIETETGWYGSIGIAKEWPISKKVSLGVAGHGFIGSMKEKEVDGFEPKWNASGFGVTATLTWVPRGLKP